ncbi:MULTISPECIES: DJ-1/PfpI family protein [Vibrio]|uniref:DJ-1/PfpI family protein n=1 Tax=Vibrio TaxID=662 RepID=UPI0001B93B76|nr:MULTISPECIES: DJ-1/PfpI family protein [Vibrio]EEX34393.1 putative isonitrile hydratase [Vibrio coralliilyticus ATCC BAA-450]MDE3898438.1 DJ-1/PfpI family protein [Vibrio sp. CC007]
MKIGYTLTPNCKMSDVVNSETIFRLHPFNKVYFVAEKKGAVCSRSGFSLVADTSFESCPKLDVLVVSGVDKDSENHANLVAFIKTQVPHVKYIIGLASGVLALHDADVIADLEVTADTESKAILKSLAVNVCDDKGVVTDGHLVTASHSSGAIEATNTVLSLLHGTWLSKFSEFYLEYEAHAHYPKPDATRLAEPNTPRPLNVGVFAASDIYLPDIVGAAEVFSSIPNSQMFYVSDSEGVSSSIFNQGPAFLPTVTYDNCPDLDVLIVGMTHPKYLNDQRTLDFILRQEKCWSAVITVCGGTFLVGATGLFKGKNVTTNYHQLSVLPNIGVKKTDKKFLADGNIFSAGPAVGSYVAGLKAVEKVVGLEWAQYIEQEVLEFNPRPLWNVSTKTVGKRARFISKLYSLIISTVFARNLNKNKLNV